MRIAEELYIEILHRKLIVSYCSSVVPELFGPPPYLGSINSSQVPHSLAHKEHCSEYRLAQPIKEDNNNLLHLVTILLLVNL
jgi:hypothetical protein